MPSAKDFRAVKIQASFFTPGLQFRVAKVLSHLLSEYGAAFDEEPVSYSMPNLPRAIPQLILKGTDNKMQLQVGPDRLDVFREEDSVTDRDATDFLRLAADLALSYLRTMEGKAGRLACVVVRLTSDATPAKTLAQHFCQPRWLKGPLNRPEDFELHAFKRFHLGDLFEINSWMRCKTAALKQGEDGQANDPNVVLVEQDFNTASEQLDTREFNSDEIRRFFELVPSEFDKVLNLYFPTEG